MCAGFGLPFLLLGPFWSTRQDSLYIAYIAVRQLARPQAPGSTLVDGLLRKDFPLRRHSGGGVPWRLPRPESACFPGHAALKDSPLGRLQVPAQGFLLTEGLKSDGASWSLPAEPGLVARFLPAILPYLWHY